MGKVLTSSSIMKLTESDFTHVGYLYHARNNCNQQINMNGKCLTWTYYHPKKYFYHKLINFDDSICTDQNGTFSCHWFKGNNHTLVTYSYDTNAILIRPLKRKKDKK